MFQPIQLQLSPFSLACPASPTRVKRSTSLDLTLSQLLCAFQHSNLDAYIKRKRPTNGHQEEPKRVYRHGPSFTHCVNSRRHDRSGARLEVGKCHDRCLERCAKICKQYRERNECIKGLPDATNAVPTEPGHGFSIAHGLNLGRGYRCHRFVMRSECLRAAENDG